MARTVDKVRRVGPDRASARPGPIPKRSLARRTAGPLAAAAVGVAGAWLGMVLGGRQTQSTGPFTVRLTTAVGKGVTQIALPPFGRITADTHLAPLRFTATLTDVDVAKLAETIRVSTVNQVVDKVQADSLSWIAPYAIRLFVASVAGGALLGLLVYRRHWRRVAQAALAAVILVGGSEGLAWGTFQRDAFLSPTFTGALSIAPSLLGPLPSALDRINAFRGELQRIVSGAGRIYSRIQSTPVLGQDEIRVLHISDIHLSPLGLDFALQLARTFDVDFVLDTGDITSFGTPAESLILQYVPRFQMPYVFVRGNHDSPGLQAAMEDVDNAIVLDGRSATVDGVSIYGLGDPLFTPDKNRTPSPEEVATEEAAAGQRIVEDLAKLATPPAILAVHNFRAAEPAQGLVPLVVAGHEHVESERVRSGTLFLVVGTTGGAGAEVFAQTGGIPLSAQVLHFLPGDPARLVAFDVIQQSPETGSLTLERHLVTEEFGNLVPSPPPTTPTTPSSSTSSPGVEPSVAPEPSPTPPPGASSSR
jgi:predicted phosphodiesterase